MKSQSLEIEKLKLDLMVKERTIESLKITKIRVLEGDSLSNFYQHKRDLQEISGVNKRINHEPFGSVEIDHEPCGSVIYEPCGSKKIKLN